MPDNKALRGKPDRSRINISERYERQYWCGKFKCSQRELVLATWCARRDNNMARALFNEATRVQDHLISARVLLKNRPARLRKVRARTKKLVGK